MRGQAELDADEGADDDEPQDESWFFGLFGPAGYFGPLTFKKVLLAFLMGYVVEQSHLPNFLGAKGVNVLNFLVLLAWATALVKGMTGGFPPASFRFVLFWTALAGAFFVAVSYGDVPSEQSGTMLKTAVTYMALYFLYYLAADDVPTIRLVVFAILCVVCLASLEIMREAIDYGLDRFNESRRAAGPFGETSIGSNRAGIYLAIFVPFFLSVVLLFRRAGIVRLAALGAFGLGTLALFYTYSRQSYLVLSLGILVLFLRRNPILACVVGLVLANYSLWAPATVVQRIEMTTTDEGVGTGVQLESSAASRFIIWSGARAMIREHPFGIGLERFKAEIGNYSEISGMDAHNQYLLVGSEAGVQGLIAMLLVFVGLATLAVRAVWRARTFEDRTLAWGFATATIGVFVGNIYGSPLFMGEVMGNYWALAGLTAKYLYIRSEDEDADEDEDDVSDEDWAEEAAPEHA
jgi:O-antigen ligase